MPKDHSSHARYHKQFPAGLEQHYRDLLRHYFGEGQSIGIDAFRSLIKASGMVQKLSEKGMDKHGMSMAKMRLLFLLLMRDEEGMLASDLSKLQGVGPNTTSSLVASLLKAGLIIRLAHPYDGRKHIIKITPAGREILLGLAPHQQQFVQTLFENFSDEELLTFSVLLNKVIDNVQHLMCADQFKPEEVGKVTQPDQPTI
jgi:DNA-binding MarR family transcriptional regulator